MDRDFCLGEVVHWTCIKATHHWYFVFEPWGSNGDWYKVIERIYR